MAKWKRCLGQDYPSPQISTCSPDWSSPYPAQLGDFYGGFITWVPCNVGTLPGGILAWKIPLVEESGVTKNLTQLSTNTFTFFHYTGMIDWIISSVQPLSHVWLFVSPWSAARQASLSITSSRRLFKLMPSNHLLLCCPLLLLPSIFPSIRVFSSESGLRIRWPNVGTSASALVLPKNIQYWFPLRLTGLILQAKGLSRVFSNTTI